ncbi:MAG: ABC transporter permease [Bacteriovoracaceae bacterium]|nr:ABC transporter permease [Bacteriovoracaceae bacterium]
MKKEFILTLFVLGISLLFGILVTAILSWIVQENPLEVIGILFRGSVGNWYNVGYSLFNATPLIFTGLSVSWAFRSGLFNIGAEGQMVIGSVAMFLVGHYFGNFPFATITMPWLFMAIMLLSASLAGGVWGAFAGAIKAYRGAHEVLCTILLNFIAYAILAYVVVDFMRDPSSQAPESLRLNSAFALSSLNWIATGTMANTALYLGIVLSAVFSFFLWKTTLGMRQRFIGDSPQTAKYIGINVRKQIVLSMFIAGALAGPAAASALLHGGLRLKEGLSHGAGFIGIAVALMGRTSALGVVLSSLFLGALQQGSLALDIETNSISRDMTVVIQAVLIIALACDKVWRAWGERLFFSKKVHVEEKEKVEEKAK